MRSKTNVSISFKILLLSLFLQDNATRVTRHLDNDKGQQPVQMVRCFAKVQIPLVIVYRL